ncbi:hypothetical protein [Aliiruegeria sabulilitoris]|uniref:hypothetical protein n=1 Tax=Aliiruegeria sabulilitoris TaxID=1510458 RepID=UPI002AA53BCE
MAPAMALSRDRMARLPNLAVALGRQSVYHEGKPGRARRASTPELPMAALARLLLILFVVLSVVYVSLSFYSRAIRRDKLEEEWDEEIRSGDREAFIREGLEEYDGSLRRKLILGVYIVPIVLIGIIIYFTNYN